ncbi:uncharacterized protein Z520_05974 [Fonsecaea multimorphosa CBS 102226]|uniref:Uncharacterized protein n=1 Tax=Fonsecaea multimorphosa CBS 102226 TaxID=1442371 RepID=A0A0D2KPM1_9EURO|nr:uncharacterized protein Z520_05974 [Fonsecaea multimorphosa CBS 102226]KIX98673.1 hypothetical protein Z520_05974 [Fonsecaea multimorphosa CBS 102226]OAL24858.1 hypothetical protein AYO22_05647 [Fonsecaea multimorphosa]
MGLPYSKEIHSAFEQVTPLVAAGFEVLQTTKDIAILLAVIQVVTVITLILILVALLALLCTVNPDLVKEREQLVTPAMQWLASWIFKYGGPAKTLLKITFVSGGLLFGYAVWQGLVTGHSEPTSGEDQSEDTEGKADEEKAEDKGKDTSNGDEKNGKDGNKKKK